MQALLKRQKGQEETEWVRAAWMVCYLLQPHSKRRLKPKDLLKGVFRQDPHHSEEKKRLLWERHQERLKAKA